MTPSERECYVRERQVQLLTENRRRLECQPDPDPSAVQAMQAAVATKLARLAIELEFWAMSGSELPMLSTVALRTTTLLWQVQDALHGRGKAGVAVNLPRLTRLAAACRFNAQQLASMGERATMEPLSHAVAQVEHTLLTFMDSRNHSQEARNWAYEVALEAVWTAEAALRAWWVRTDSAEQMLAALVPVSFNEPEPEALPAP